MRTVYMDRIEIRAELPPGAERILTPEALGFLLALHDRFENTRQSLLSRRRDVQAQLDRGAKPDFLVATREIRDSAWTVASIPSEIQDRRVEITGPVERKMMINALNSGANVYMADMEDSHSPTWDATLAGQGNLFDSVRRTISFQAPEGKAYSLAERVAVLFVRPRGWHMDERHVFIDQKPISASLFDFGLFFFHNAREQVKRGTRPYFYLPKMESHLEARLWNDVFIEAQRRLDVAVGTIRATVLIETILAAFEMDEILYELRDHSAGLNCGRWDYIFSFIKKFSRQPSFILPDRAQVTMTSHFLKSYSHLLIQTCHRRGVHAMGGMAAYIPNKSNPIANDIALKKVSEDKMREVRAGHDGTWVAHPGLVATAKDIFDREMSTPNQIHNKRGDVRVSGADLLTVPEGEITPEGLRMNINVALFYTEAWLRGLGCVPLHDLMEDAATAEIARAQVWQWIHFPEGKFTVRSGGKFADGGKITAELVLGILQHEIDLAREQTPAERGERRFNQAGEILSKIFVNNEFTEFLTLEAYKHLS